MGGAVSAARWFTVWQGATRRRRLLDVGHDVDDTRQVCPSLADGDHSEPGASRRDPGLLGSQLWTSHMEAHSSWSPAGPYAQVTDWLLLLCLHMVWFIRLSLCLSHSLGTVTAKVHDMPVLTAIGTGHIALPLNTLLLLLYQYYYNYYFSNRFSLPGTNACKICPLFNSNNDNNNNNNRFRPFVWDYSGELVPEETFTTHINHPLSAFSIYYDP